MITKKLLLAGVAAGVFAAAGAASAGDLTFRTSLVAAAGPPVVLAEPVNDIDLADSADADGAGPSALRTYFLANEAADEVVASSQQGVAALLYDLSGASTLPGGNSTFTLTLTNAVFGVGGMDAADVIPQTVGCGTVALSAGGGAAQSTATFVISSAAGNCTGLNLRVPFQMSSAGAVTVSAVAATDAGTPIDPPQPSLQIVTLADAFSVDINGAIAAADAASDDADLDTFAEFPDYDTLGGDGILGSVTIDVNTAVNNDLVGTGAVAGDVSSASVTLTGDLSGVGAIGLGAATLSAAPTAGTCRTASSATATGAPIVAAIAGARADVTVAPQAGCTFDASRYNFSVTYGLTTAVYGADTFTDSGSLESIQREGVNVVVPWMNTPRIMQNNPLQPDNIIRVGNAGSIDRQVYAEVVNSAVEASGYSDQGIVLIGEAEAGGELVIRSSTLATKLGDYGRGDINLSIEGDDDGTDITVRRFQRNNDGGFTEVENGTVAQDLGYSTAPFVNPQ